LAQEDRHSRAIEEPLPQDPQTIASLEARNALKQFDEVIEAVEYFIQPGYSFKLRPSLILKLHRTVLQGLNHYAGVWRPGKVEIGGSKHTPPDAFQVPELIEELCDYVNEHWSKSALHLAAYVLWRMNWIHPFVDGNGRTARAVAYLVLCIRLGYRLPGTKTIPDHIADNKRPYYEALEQVDLSCKDGQLKLDPMEKLLSDLLAAQLLSVFDAASHEATPNSDLRC
jgi:Fic family protein